MQSQLPLYPEQASNFAPQVDALMLFITAICLFFAVAVTAAIVIFFFKFHRKQPDAVGIAIHGDSRLEAVWMIIPLILARQDTTVIKVSLAGTTSRPAPY